MASLGVLAIENRIAWQAGEFRALHYNRNTAALSLTDCILLASTGPEDKLATSDQALVTVAHALNLTVLPLPDASGRRPSV